MGLPLFFWGKKLKAATQKFTRRLAALILVLVLAVGFSTAAWAEGVPRRETPVYKVAFYAAKLLPCPG